VDGDVVEWIIGGIRVPASVGKSTWPGGARERNPVSGLDNMYFWTPVPGDGVWGGAPITGNVGSMLHVNVPSLFFC